MTKANEVLKTELGKTKLKLRGQEDETENLYTALDDLEQYTRKNSLEIQGIPDQCYSTTEEVVLKLASVLNLMLILPTLRYHTNSNAVAITLARLL